MRFKAALQILLSVHNFLVTFTALAYLLACAGSGDAAAASAPMARQIAMVSSRSNYLMSEPIGLVVYCPHTDSATQSVLVKLCAGDGGTVILAVRVAANDPGPQSEVDSNRMCLLPDVSSPRQ